MSKSIDIIKKNTYAALFASTKVGIDVSVERTTYTFMPHQQNAGQNNGTKITNKPFDKVETFKYMGMTLKIQDCMIGYLSAMSPEPCSRTGVQKELNWEPPDALHEQVICLSAPAQLAASVAKSGTHVPALDAGSSLPAHNKCYRSMRSTK
jgi:hypothetical protein